MIRNAVTRREAGRIRPFLIWAGGLTAVFVWFILIFYIFYVYPRPSRLPDPLLSTRDIPRSTGYRPDQMIRLIDRLSDGSAASIHRSPRWEEGVSALRDYHYASELPGSGGLRWQAGVGHLEHAEMEAMDALFAPTPSDYSFEVPIGAGARMDLAMAVLSNKPGAPVSARFRVQVEDGATPGSVVTAMDRLVAAPIRKDRIGFRDELEEYLWPDIRGKYGSWKRAEVDLSRWEGRTVRLTLSTRASRETNGAVAAAWGNPVIFSRIPDVPDPPAAPNVIVIMVDSMRPDALGSYGSKRRATPNIDRIGSEGVVFRQARSASVDTRTSETAFFTGRYPNEIGIHYRNRGLDPLELRHFDSLGLRTMPEVFAEKGYLTAAFANNMFLLQFTGTGYDLGFQEIYNNNRATLDTVDITDRAVAWLTRNKDRRFFLFLNYNSPHGRYRPPVKNLLQAATPMEIVGYDLHGWYLGSVDYVDEYIGVLRTALERLGLLDHTLIVVTADHGQVFDPVHDYGVPDRKLRTYNRHGYTLYDEEIHVPLILRLSGAIGPGRVVDDSVSLVDLLPTLEELAGASPSTVRSGRSLVPLIRGDTVPARPVYADGRYMKAVVWSGIKYIDREKPAARLLRRTPDGDRLVFQSEELYDLNQDPDEHRNLMMLSYETSASTARRMRAMLFNDGPPDLIVNQVRLVAGDAGHSFSGRVSAPGKPGVRIRFFETVPGKRLPKMKKSDEASLDFSADLPQGASAGFLFETDPPSTPVRLDLLMDGRPIDPDRLYGGPMGLAGLLFPAQWVPVSALAFLGTEGGIYEDPIYDPRYETGVFFWRTPYLDYVGSTDANSGLRPEVKDILLDWGYIQKGEKK